MKRAKRPKKVKNKEDAKLNNAGFSLLELLIAVLILGVVSAPFLHSFLTTTRVNKKAKTKLNATMAAQDIMEGLKGYRAEEIQAQFSASENFVLIANEAVSNPANIIYQPADPDGFQYVLTNLKYEGNTYDARIKVDPEPYKDGSKVNTAATAEAIKPNDDWIANISEMDNNYDGVYMADSNNVQEKALENLQMQDPTADWAHTTRTFTIIITKNGVTSAGNEKQLITVDVDYVYENPSTHVKRTFQLTNTAYNNVDTADSGCSLRNMFFFYYPNYQIGKDRIKIINSDGIPFTVYLMKQKTTDEAELPHLFSLETSYRPVIALYENTLFDTRKTKIRSNFTKNLFFSEDTERFNSDENKINGTTPLFYFGGIGSQTVDQIKNLNETANKTASALEADQSVSKEKLNRMFYVVVEIYEKGSYGTWDADKRVEVLDSSKLNE